MPISKYVSYIMAVSFIGGGNWSTWTKSLTCHKSLTNPNPCSQVKINISDENFDHYKKIDTSISVSLYYCNHYSNKFENYPNLYLYILIRLRHLSFCNLVYCLGKEKYTDSVFPTPLFWCSVVYAHCRFWKKNCLCNDSEVK